ncbi:MAG: thioredoxin domain-containing protein [Sulfurovaceae bacterium]|nr:thioredoxin domain-containing protein [Sulfurovaceae bacterium]
MRIKVVLIILVSLTFNLNAMSEIKVKKYMKNYIEKKMNSPVKKIEVISKYHIDAAPDWEVYFLSMRIDITMGGKTKTTTVPQTIFTKGDKITFKLMKKGVDGKKNTNYAKLLKPKVPDSAYDNAHFIAGSKNAPHKILVFSDPFCPYCQEKVPEVVALVKANPKIYGLYYYHLPLLKIHPAADLTTKAMHLFHKKGDIDKMIALYDLFLEPTETNPKEIIKAIKEKTGVTFTLAQLSTQALKNAIKVDLKMRKQLQVTSTPTIFIDGIWDKKRENYKAYAR